MRHPKAGAVVGDTVHLAGTERAGDYLDLTLNGPLELISFGIPFVAVPDVLIVAGESEQPKA